jgi:hypothetical protein
MATDKNLGPALIEREQYIALALEHLLDTETYRQLSNADASLFVDTTKQMITEWVTLHTSKHAHNQHITAADGKYILRSLSVQDPFAYFYVLAKVHKSPLTTRPIVSVSGSLLQGLGRWVDQELQRVVDCMHYTLCSSTELVNDISALPLLPYTSAVNKGAGPVMLFTADATSMYTNIDTTHAMSTILHYLETNPDVVKAAKVHPSSLMAALELCMTRNIFVFDDTYWLQLRGTAMGAPPAPMYATLYYAIHEAEMIPQFPELLLYRRYIDDMFGVWIAQPIESTAIATSSRFQHFQASVHDYGGLSWSFTTSTTEIVFLDLLIQCTPVLCPVETTTTTTTTTTMMVQLTTTIHEKAMSKHLYIPPHSCHSQGLLKGLVAGYINRLVSLCIGNSNSNSNSTNKGQEQFTKLYHRLLQRGYTVPRLNRVFQDCLQAAYHKQAFLVQSLCTSSSSSPQLSLLSTVTTVTTPTPTSSSSLLMLLPLTMPSVMPQRLCLMIQAVLQQVHQVRLLQASASITMESTRLTQNIPSVLVQNLQQRVHQTRQIQAGEANNLTMDGQVQHIQAQQQAGSASSASAGATTAKLTPKPAKAGRSLVKPGRDRSDDIFLHVVNHPMLPSRRELLHCISTHLLESQYHSKPKQPIYTRTGRLYVVPQVTLAVHQCKPLKSLLAPRKLRKLPNASRVAAILSRCYGIQPPVDAACTLDRDNAMAANVDNINQDSDRDNNNSSRTNQAESDSDQISNSVQPESRPEQPHCTVS